MSKPVEYRNVVLAYSGGTDTSVCIPYLKKELGARRVIAVVVDVGQGGDLQEVSARALASGADHVEVVKGVHTLITDYAYPAIMANALYERRYPNSTALARPLIARALVETGKEFGADAVAHGCTGKGNDHIRFHNTIVALDPGMAILTPAAEWGMTREETIAYGQRHNVPGLTTRSIYSVDENILGRAVECGSLEDPAIEPDEAVFALTRAIGDTPSAAADITIEFVSGRPIAIDGRPLSPVELIKQLNQVAGDHGVGRIDMIENRLPGYKSREIYETPAMTVLISAHTALEALTLPKEANHHKRQAVDDVYAQLVYDGLWDNPLRQFLHAYLLASQVVVTGQVRVRLHRGTATVVGLESSNSLYDPKIATYSEGDRFNHTDGLAFGRVWGLSTQLWAQKHQSTQF